jgi:predicted RNA binding protein YcfA (HicA-like mRNA interferase family)
LPGLPNCKGREAVRAFENLGYTVSRQNGSHVRMQCPGRASITVPVHHGKDLAPGTLRALIRTSGFAVEEFADEL